MALLPHLRLSALGALPYAITILGDVRKKEDLENAEKAIQLLDVQIFT
jgi:hypothetical protein